MPLTPDRNPGIRLEEGIVLEDTTPPSGPGAMGFESGAFVFEDSIGVFNPRELFPTTHRALDQLPHDIAETAYLKLTKGGNDNYTNATWWTTSGMTQKIREYVITYDGNDDATQVVAKQYDGAGALVETYTLPIAYVTGDPDNIDAVLT